MLKNEVADVGIVCEFKDVLAEIVHTLEVAIVRVIEGKCVENFNHFRAKSFVPTERSSGV